MSTSAENGSVMGNGPIATLTIEVHALRADPRSPQWKYEARLVDGLTSPPVLATGRGPTFSEAIRHMASALPRP